MKRIIALFLLAGFVIAACGKPIVDESHTRDNGAAERKAQKAAGSGDE